MVLQTLPFIAAFLDGHKDQHALIYSATAATLVVGAIGLSLSRNDATSSSAKHAPPRVAAWPIIGSAIEFGADCRAFLKKYFALLKTPIFTANIAGKDYHFVDTSYAEFSPERLFRSPALHFRPMANDAMVYGFGIEPGLLTKVNGEDGNSKELNALYHSHMMKPEGLNELLTQAQARLDQLVLHDEALYPSTPAATTTKPLHWLIRESLFRATIGAVISDSVVAKDASASLQHFEAFDEKFPLLLSKLPAWAFPKAIQGRRAVQDLCQGTAFYDGLSKMIQNRNELLAHERFGITSPEEIARLSFVLVWAAAANTMPTGFWLIYNLLKQKETAYAAIQKEVLEFYQGRTQEGPLSLTELDLLVGLNSALTEALRIHSESMIARDVVEDFELDLKISSSDDHKYFLKKNSRVAVMMSCLHMDESVFADADTFQWDRFLPDDQGKPPVFTKNGKLLSTPVRPFGGGVSMCPGRKFASYEIRAFVAELLYRYDLELVDKEKELKTDPSRAGLGINVPLEDVDVRITKRK